MSGDSEAQDDELLALESIFGDAFRSYNRRKEEEGKNHNDQEKLPLKGGELKVYIELPHPFYLTCVSNISGKLERPEVEHLPPLFLHFTFPEIYPSALSPDYTLSCKWINQVQLSLLCNQLDTLWKQSSGSEVMFTWTQYLKEETLCLLNLTDSLMVPGNCVTRTRKLSEKVTACKETDCENNGALDEMLTLDVDGASSVIDPRAIQDIAPTTNLFRLLNEYDKEMRKIVFDSKLFECKVCFCERTGSNCIEFWPCRHVYCKDCMKCFFEIQIKEGNIKYLKCPEDKCDSEANPKQVESLVSDDLYHKWDLMLLNSTLSSLGDIQPCPRQHCQYPVTIEDQQGQCPGCAFVFCGLCRFGWHGLEKCRLKSGEAKNVVDKYMHGSIQEKQALEDRYGKKYLNCLVSEYLSSNYLDQNAKNCPKCRANIEKIDGCNKMTCKRCAANFCWLCEKFLDSMNPYSHFNNPASDCYNMLFHGIDVFGDFDDLEDEEEENA